MAGMRMGLGMEMRMSQQLIMTPQLQQAIKLLQLSRTELEELIDQSLVENPALEMKPVEQEEEEKEKDKEESEAEETQDFADEQAQLSVDDEWQSYIESGAGVIQESRAHVSDSGEESNPLEATISKKTTLSDHLYWQLDISEFSDRERSILEYLIGSIDEDGYLFVSLRDLLASNIELEKLVSDILLEGEIEPILEEESIEYFDIFHEIKPKVDAKKKRKKKAAPAMFDDEQSEESDISHINERHCGILEVMLQKLQSFDPPGVGARDLRECLLNQLKAMKMGDSLAYRVVESNMQYLEQKDLKRIARLQKAEIDDVVDAYQFITELEPKPGRPYSREVTQYVVPDVYIYKRMNEYVVSMNQDSIPKLRINPQYKTMSESVKDEKSQNKNPQDVDDSQMTYLYIQEKIKAGEWLMKSIEQRQKTIYRVTKSILKYQYEFFEKGIDFLKPLVLKDVAEDIDVHESTVSRITTNKYVYTPQGIFELKYFFTSGIDQGDGDIVSSKKIKDYIRKLVDSENKKKPYTDLQIKTELEKKANIKVARRTVAKYREAMNILPSNKRKRLY